MTPRKITYALIVSLMLTASGAVTPAAADPHKVRIASSSSEDPEKSGVYVWLQAFRLSLEQSGFATELYPNSALGGEQDRTEMLRLGLLQVNDSGSSEIKSFSPLFGSISLPFLFKSTEHFDNLIRGGEFLRRINNDTAPNGLRVVDVAFLGGMTGLFNTKHPVQRLEDLIELRMRAMERSDLMILNAWGVSGTQVAWEEVPQALETGIAHGYFNAPMVPIIFGHTRQIRYFTNLRMTPSLRVIAVSELWFKSLSPDQIKQFTKAVAAGRRANRAWAYDIQQRERNMLESRGITVSEISDHERGRFSARVRDNYHRIIPAKYVKTAIELAERHGTEQ